MNYAKDLRSFIAEHRNEENAFHMEKYMRNQYTFYGIKTPERRALVKAFVNEHGKPNERLKEVVDELWSFKERELKCVAIDFLVAQQKLLQAEDLRFVKKLIVTESWWDSVDPLASNVVGPLIKRHPDLIEEQLEGWIYSDNMWLNRTAILFQLRYKDKTNEDLLYRYIKLHTASKEFFIQKAIGWALREYSKTNRSSVINFIGNNQLAPLSKREGLKYILSHPEKE
ncbi:DNA alkylation repair protein [Metabacillus herbersteinensis]|uniref:DNA alkylation repair protein n=1 Tax=Metabacillus herbersteinensis TaxID=283816 RepID=A0ABV6GBF1_9BACI